MKSRSEVLRGVISAVSGVVLFAGMARAEEVIALYHFNDMATLNNGTTRVVKQTSLGLEPSLTLVEKGGVMVAPNGGTGLAFTDAEGIAYAASRAASWTTGLVGAGNAGSNTFVMETSTRLFQDMELRFDAYSSSSTGPSGLLLEYAVGSNDYVALASLSLPRDGAWHAYTNDLVGIAQVEQAPRLRIRGTWSADATAGSARLDNLQLTGSFTNGLNRLSLFTFSGSTPTDSAGATGIKVDNLSAVKCSSFSYLTDSPNARSGQPLLSAIQQPYTNELRASYYTFTLTPTNRTFFVPSHIHFYGHSGVSTGIVEAAVVVGGSVYSMGTNALTTTNAPFVFSMPDRIPLPVSTPLECRLYFVVEGNSSLRIDDLEMVGGLGAFQTNTVVALFPFTGSTLTNTAGNSRVNVSGITSNGTGAVGFYTSAYSSESGAPAMTVNGLNGDAQNRYVSFDITSRKDTAFSPTLLRLYARAGSGTGTIRADLVSGGVSNSLGTYGLDATERLYYFAVPSGLLTNTTSTVQVRLYGWGFATSATTLRVDDWTVEGALTDLRRKGTLIRVF